MRKTFALLFAILTILFCFVTVGCTPDYGYESFYGIVKFSKIINGPIIYIPEYGEVKIPENDGYCSCFDGHGEEEPPYYLRPGDLVRVNFKYAKGAGGVTVMEKYPAEFDRKAGRIEVLRQNVFLDKNDTGYVLSFQSDEKTESASVGDTLHFYYYYGDVNEYGVSRECKQLYADGEITSKADDVITVDLTILGEEKRFLERYVSMQIETAEE